LFLEGNEKITLHVKSFWRWNLMLTSAVPFKTRASKKTEGNWPTCLRFRANGNGRLDHSFRGDGLISDDLKIGNPVYSREPPMNERPDFARLGAGVGRKQACFAKGMSHRI
jgi:hypothetical protein